MSFDAGADREAVPRHLKRASAIGKALTVG